MGDEIINAINQCLNEKERKIIKSRFGICTEVSLTIEEVCGKFNITNKELREIERKILSYLKSL